MTTETRRRRTDRKGQQRQSKGTRSVTSWRGPGLAITATEDTRVVASTESLARRADEITRQLEEAAAFIPPDVYEEGAPRALLPHLNRVGW
jgi:hypothetical protein